VEQPDRNDMAGMTAIAPESWPAGAMMATVNGHAPEGQMPSAPQQAAAEAVAGAAGRIDADTVIRILAAVVVLSVAAFAAIISYSHIFDLGRAHGQDGTAARLLPLSVDGLIAAASLVMLHAARNNLPVPFLSRAMLALGVGATVAANVAYGLPFGATGALVSAWPAVAFVGSVEMAVRFVRDARHVATGSDSISDSDTRDGGPEQQRDNGNGGRSRDRARPPGNRRQRQKPTGSDKVRDILLRHPGLAKADVARRAGVSVRTVERVLGEARDATAA
jgi:Protein of unknown function (DUF2637)